MRVKIVRKHAPVCQSVSAESERVERAELLLITILFLHTTGPFNKPHNQTRPLQSASFKSIFNPRYRIKKATRVTSATADDPFLLVPVLTALCQLPRVLFSLLSGGSALFTVALSSRGALATYL